ncbi:restriction endonuclease subunit S, partial [Streptococcus pneumoniae]
MTQPWPMPWSIKIMSSIHTKNSSLKSKSRFNEMFGENKIFESIDNLFDIIDGDRGKNYPKSDELFSEEYCLFLNTKNVTKNGFSFDTKQFITKTKDKLLRKGKLERYDIVLTTRGTVGNVAYYDELIKYKHLRINSGMVILRPKTPNLNQKFIIHVLRNNNYSRVISGSAQPQLPITKLKKILLPLPPLALQNEFADFVVQVDKSQYLREHSTGATIPHLNKNILLDLQLELLGIEEQENIICILNTIKGLITKRKLQLDELNLLVKSRFNEMFGENKIFESIDNLFDIIDGDRGKNYPKSDELFSEEYCLFLNTKNVTKNGFSFDTKQFITKTKDKLLRKGKLERYDIVLTTRGTVGNVAYYDELIKYKHLRINSGMVILRPKTPNLNQKFIIHVLRNNNYSRVISGSAQPQLPITKLKKILLPLPPLALQNEFADFVVQVDKSQ